jgi:hypothetical protein
MFWEYDIFISLSCFLFYIPLNKKLIIHRLFHIYDLIYKN